MHLGTSGWQRMYVAGQFVEVWEDPTVPFGVGPGDLNGFVERGDWVALFNALVLCGRQEYEASR